MKGKILKNSIQSRVVFTLFVSMLMAGPTIAREKPNEISHDGLHLQKNTKLAEVYLKPGETLAGYDKVAMTDVYVSFVKNWQRDYNRDSVGLENRVSDSDVATIKKRLAKEFVKVFTKELQDKGGYEVVNHEAKDVLVLRPAIVNLRVNAPDTRRAGMGATFVSSAGQMTLYLELYDSVTGDILARVIDAKVAGDHGIAHRGGEFQNRADADQVLRQWADILRQQLDHANKAAADNDG